MFSVSKLVLALLTKSTKQSKEAPFFLTFTSFLSMLYWTEFKENIIV